ncbi:SDR family oxidoreductase [Eisenibacter elegans]|jgi:short-subunit dehydrogenase|uniref:SDR family oxidoreductase n=1 Tax=Eisenibacter elegans TaxID=997 RepID=UPI0003FAF4C9|nr:SDR family oxidoreductase [Eisenibacter elegans]
MQNKVVLITGGSSGIGKAYAQAFGLAGAKVVITGRKEGPLQEAAAWLEEQGIETLAVVADVAQETDCERMVALAVERFGRLDILINNAGISMRALFAEAELSVIRQLMEINFFGTVYATKYALPHILASKGSIVGVSSIAGYRGLPARTGYSASKFAMRGFFEALRTELRYTGVHLLLVSPGFTASNIRQTALAKDGSAQGETPRDEGKMMSAEEVAQHTLKAVQRRRRDLVLTGQGKLTVILNKLFPALMDKLVYNAMAKEKDSPLKRQ